MLTIIGSFLKTLAHVVVKSTALYFPILWTHVHSDPQCFSVVLIFYGLCSIHSTSAFPECGIDRCCSPRDRWVADVIPVGNLQDLSETPHVEGVKFLDNFVVQVLQL